MRGKKVSGKINKSLTVLTSIVIVGLLVLVGRADNAGIYKNDAISIVPDYIPVIENSVTIGSKTYTKDKPMKVVELVAQDMQAELCYQIGSGMPVSITEATQLGKQDAYKMGLTSIIAQGQENSKYKVQLYVEQYNGEKVWKNANETWGEKTLDYRYVNAEDNSLLLYSDGVNTYETKNIFAVGIFGDMNMVDKIDYEIMTMDEYNALSKDDMDDIDLLYINIVGGAARYGYFKDVYSAKYPGVQVKSFLELNEDMTAENAWYTYRKITENDMAVVFCSVSPTSYASSTGNLLKIMYMANGADHDIFKENFWQNQVSDTEWQGDFGSVEIDNSTASGTIDLIYPKYNQYAPNNPPETTKATWAQDMFVQEYGNKIVYSLKRKLGTDVDWQSYYYMSWGSEDRGKNVWKNVMLTGQWDALYSMPGTVETVGSSGVNLDKEGSSYGDLYNIYGANNKFSMGSELRYILGDYSKLVDMTEKVQILEIEPAGTYKYDTLNKEKALEIFRYLTISTEGTSISDSNCIDYIQVKSVAMNEFIAMTDNLLCNYDLIIVGDVVDSQYAAFLNGTYSEQGGSVSYVDYADGWKTYNMVYSGNDLTDKAYAKLEAYILAKKTVVLADDVYDRDTDVVDEESNVYKVATLAKTNPNIVNASMTKGRPKVYTARPKFTTDEKYNVTHGANNIANINLTAGEISSFNFPINTNKPSTGYVLKIYADRDANGVFESSSDESNELIYDKSITTDEGGNFTAVLSLPAGIRGYLKWRAEITEVATGLSNDNEGAFVIGYTNTEIKEVKVLQISPEYGSRLSLKNNTNFINAFNAASSVTGLRLPLDENGIPTTVEEVTVEQFEDKYNPEKGGTEYKGDNNDILKRENGGYDIIVLGFADAYGYEDISDEHGAISNIIDYIQSGNSVLMAHDVLSYTSYSDSTVTNKNVSWKNTSQVKLDNDNILTGQDAFNRFMGWSYNITSRLRNIIGMDRYNVSLTTDKKNTAEGYTQGFANSLNLTNATRYFSNSVHRVNSGQINMYPYNIGEEDVPVARTHAQYFQLNLENIEDEEDVTVWYTLDKDASSNTYKYFDLSGNDALNNYYIYSKGNITYTGAGHSDLDESVTELNLFVNTIIRAIGASNNLPVISFEDSVMVDEKNYEIIVRNMELPQNIEFTVIDPDFFEKQGKFREGYAYVDLNSDSRYDEEDILISAYDGNENDFLINANKNNLAFTDIVNGMSAENKDVINKLFMENRLVITVQVKDNNNGIGISKLSLINKDLFELN